MVSNMSGSDKKYCMYEDAELEKKFKASFLRNNRNMYSELEEAIKNGDKELAYRLVHSAKGNAGQAKMKKLARAAAEIEKLLNDGEINIPEEQLKELKNELESAIASLKPLIDEIEALKEKNTLDKEQITALLEKLKPLLEGNDSECLELLDDIRSMPEAEVLAAQIEQYDFGNALETLEGITNAISAASRLQ
jgi:HPt (histidine-containing phosphotransfer) domain-containing protein